LITLLFQLLSLLVRLYIWALILAAAFSMLAAFNVLDTRNRLVWSVGEFLYRITDPVLRPIRNLLPRMGGIDISPWIAVLLLQFIVLQMIGRVYGAIETGSWQSLIY
jgi:YggT family protein